MGNLSSIQTGESELTTTSAPKDVAGVRVPLRLTRFEWIVLQNLQAKRHMEYKNLAHHDIYPAQRLAELPLRLYPILFATELLRLCGFFSCDHVLNQPTLGR
jgi:hypothetical protein